MKLLHRPEEMHPFEQAQVDHHHEANLLHARQTAIAETRYHFRDRHKDLTPEQILSVAAKFEAYLTAPKTVLGDKEEAQ